MLHDDEGSVVERCMRAECIEKPLEGFRWREVVRRIKERDANRLSDAAHRAFGVSREHGHAALEPEFLRVGCNGAKRATMAFEEKRMIGATRKRFKRKGTRPGERVDDDRALEGDVVPENRKKSLADLVRRRSCAAPSRGVEAS